MIKLRDIQDSITDLLGSKFTTYDLYVDANTTDIKKPTFSVNVKPLKNTNYRLNKYKMVSIYISYINQNQTHEENLEVMDQLDNIFNSCLKVNDRNLFIDEISYSENGFLTANFTLKFYDGDIVESTAEKMQTLNLNIEKE